MQIKLIVFIHLLIFKGVLFIHLLIFVIHLLIFQFLKKA